ncbi:MAG: hypothetical protein P8078_12690, partial [bacterium]
TRISHKKKVLDSDFDFKFLYILFELEDLLFKSFVVILSYHDIKEATELLIYNACFHLSTL